MLDRRLRVTAIVLAILGIAVAGYLVYVHYAGIEPACSIAHGCIKVQSSQWAEIRGVPVALLGLIGYVSILGALLLLRGEWQRGASAGLSLFGFLYSAYLTYREAFSIEAWCQWCLMSAILLTLLAIVTLWRLLAWDGEEPVERDPVPVEPPDVPAGDGAPRTPTPV